MYLYYLFIYNNAIKSPPHKEPFNKTFTWKFVNMTQQHKTSLTIGVFGRRDA